MPPTPLKLISLNIEKNRHLDRIIPFFKKEIPDVILLQEVLEHDVPLLEDALQMKCTFAPIAEFSLQGTATVVGQAIFTHLPLLKTYKEYYYGTENPLPFIELGPGASELTARVLNVIQVVKERTQYHVANTHFTWTPNGEPSGKQYQDLKRLLSLLVPFSELIFCGDFNSPRGTAIFDTLASKFKDNIPPHITTTIDKNLHKAGNLQLVVDGIFTTPHYTVCSIKLVDGVSDHLALVAEVVRKETA